MIESTVTPTGTNFRAIGKVRQHEIYFDEPEDKGGGDTAPTPAEMICTALAACTTITLQMYLQHKGWNVEVKSVHVAYATIDGVGTFQREVILDGATAEQLPRITAVANSCPVHKLLSKENAIQTEIKN